MDIKNNFHIITIYNVKLKNLIFIKSLKINIIYFFILNLIENETISIKQLKLFI